MKVRTPEIKVASQYAEIVTYRRLFYRPLIRVNKILVFANCGRVSAQGHLGLTLRILYTIRGRFLLRDAKPSIVSNRKTIEQINL